MPHIPMPGGEYVVLISRNPTAARDKLYKTLRSFRDKGGWKYYPKPSDEEVNELLMCHIQTKHRGTCLMVLTLAPRRVRYLHKVLQPADY
jgi:hypothetical protein